MTHVAAKSKADEGIIGDPQFPAKANIANSFRNYVIAIKVFAVFLILEGLYWTGFLIYVLVFSEYPRSISHINALDILTYVPVATLIAWSFILGIGSFRMFRWSRVCIIWWWCLRLFRIIYKDSLFLYACKQGVLNQLPPLPIPPSLSIVLVFISIYAPLVFIVFYSHKKVKAAFESKDQCIRWNDKHPSLLWLINIGILLIIVFQEWRKW